MNRAKLVPAAKGNGLAVTHGAYAVLQLGPRAEEIAGALREVVPAYSGSDDAALQLLGLVLAQVERAASAFERGEEAGQQHPVGQGSSRSRSQREDLKRLSADARGWANTARRLLNDLGLTPTSRATLGLDITRARGEALRAHLEVHYGDDRG